MVSFKIAILVMVLGTLVDILWSIKKKRVRYSIKTWLMTYRHLLSLTWIMFFLPISVDFLRYVVSWSNPLSYKYGVDTLTGYVFYQYPLWGFITIMTVVYLVAKWGTQQVWKFTPEELEYRKANNKRWNDRIRRFLHLKVKE